MTLTLLKTLKLKRNSIMGNTITLFDPFVVNPVDTMQNAYDTVKDVSTSSRFRSIVDTERKLPKRDGTTNTYELSKDTGLELSDKYVCDPIVNIHHKCNVKDVLDNTLVQEINIKCYCDGSQVIDITYWQQPLLEAICEDE